MKSMKILQKELSELESDMKTIKDKINNKRLDLAEHCPVKLGDKVDVNGYPHQGKQIVVSSIDYSEYQDWTGKNKTHYLCKGYVLKKDGTTSCHVGEHRC